MKKALYEKATGKVVNLIVVDDEARWQLPEGHDVVPVEGVVVAIGDTWDGTQFVPYEPTEEEVAAQAFATSDAWLINYNLIEVGRAALQNWSTLSSANKDAILKTLLALALQR